MNRRLLVTAAIGIALVISAAIVVSMNGNDKPIITTNPPPADEEPQDAQVDPTPDTQTLPPSTDDDQNDDQNEEQDDPDDPELPDDDEDGPGYDDEDDPEDEGKAHGLQNAIQAHIKNLEKAEMKGKSPPPGLQNSLQSLTEKYAEILSGEKTTGKAKGHDKGT